MGMRIGANLKKLSNEIFYIENAEAGIKRLEESGLKVSEPATGIGLVDVLMLAVPDLLINKISTEVVPGIPKDAAMSFLLGHIKIELAILLLGSNPASDAAMIAMDYGRDKLIKEDWKKVLTDESLHEVLTKMLKLNNKS